ncbi:hypothetical protein [Streptomyces zaomyceticus]|uniref:hypothetical protein n=1 Tax=Streptomyces zaomyceticus TaxID=68286 RepID=UPI00068FED99|nr:hypothetical protein [Streptomyces zaomyceticus]WSQ21792.1 hypothetical protein OG237_32355 [Streptomyces zaomyceticus]
MNVCQLCEARETDAYLCTGCTRALAKQLLRMPSLYRALAAFLPPAARGSQHGGHAQAVDGALPVDEHVLDLRGPGGMVATLESWREALHDARRWPTPTLGVSIPNRVGSAAAALHHSLDWIVQHWPAAGDLAREIRDLHGAAASVVHPRLAEERGTRLGKCPAIDPSGAVCGAILRHYPGERAVTCRWCGCAFEPHEWEALRKWIDLDQAGAGTTSPAQDAQEAHPSHA